MSSQIKTKALPILILGLAFFTFQLFLLSRSFSAEYNIYLRVLEQLQTNNPFWTLLWFSSELIGEIGLIFRFAGACLFTVFAWQLFRKKHHALPYLRKAVLLEGAYYLFNLPFIVSLFARPQTTTVNLEAGLSYSLQILLVTPTFFMLYTKLKKQNTDHTTLFKWGATAIVAFTFALWTKHFLLNLYALPVSFSEPILLLGFLNSTLTIFVAGVILTFAFWPSIRKKQTTFNSKAAGIAFLLMGIYWAIYLMVAFFNSRYMSFLFLTDFWAIAFIILGIGVIHKRDPN